MLLDDGSSCSSMMPRHTAAWQPVSPIAHICRFRRWHFALFFGQNATSSIMPFGTIFVSDKEANDDVEIACGVF